MFGSSSSSSSGQPQTENPGNSSSENTQPLLTETNPAEYHNLATDPHLVEMINQLLKKNFDMSELFQLVEGVNSSDRFKQHYGVIGLRKLLSNDQPPIQEVIDCQVVSRLIEFMQNSAEPHLQLESAWALTNIASGTSQQTQHIIDKGGLPHFIQLLRSSRIEVAEQAIWAIGNIAGDSPVFRDMILKLGGLPPLLQVVNTTTSKANIKHGTWAISNLCRGNPLPDISLVEQAIPTLCAVIQRVNDVDVLTDAAWAVSYLSRLEAKIQPVIDTGVIPALVNHLNNPYIALVIPCLRTLGNIVTGNEHQTNMVLAVPGFLENIFILLTHKKKAIRRECCWTLSNITAGSTNQIEVILNNKDYVYALINAASSDVPEVRREAAWVFSNATKNCSIAQLERMIAYNVLDSFITLLDCEDNKTVEVALEAINNILNWGAVAENNEQGAENRFLVLLEEKGGVDKIEELQNHTNNEVYLKALRILETHFEEPNE